MEPFTFTKGRTPLLVSMPHVGTYIPPEIARAMTPAGREVPDTDWHLPELYDFLDDLGASVLVATHSRYVIDVNRPPDGSTLYPGARNTELCPTTRFDDAPIYLQGRVPDADETRGRLDLIWRPYHAALERVLLRIRELFGYALLFDAHSIASRVPRFFDGELPDFNLGTAQGTAAPAELGQRLLRVATEGTGFTGVLDGRFTGGYITRHFGRPSERLFAVQLELSQRTYMDEAPPYRFDPVHAMRVRPTLRHLVRTLVDWKPQ